MTRREREITNIDEILEIMDKAKVLHLAMCDGDMPYVIAMNYGYTYEDGKMTVYLHGALKGYKYEVLSSNSNVCFCTETDLIPFEGDVACKYGIAYSCVIGRGKAELVNDPQEKIKALSVLMKTQTGKAFDFTEALAAVVNIIRIDVDEFTAKKRPLPKQ